MRGIITVMTDPAYRKLGLAGKLMRHVLSVYGKDSLFIFLFANPSVLEFYPHFGFSRAPQRKYVFLKFHPQYLRKEPFCKWNKELSHTR